MPLLRARSVRGRPQASGETARTGRAARLPNAPWPEAARRRPRALAAPVPRRVVAGGPWRPGSPPVWALLPERRQLELAEELDLMPQLDAVLLPGAPPRLRHQRNRIRRLRSVGVLDEVRVLGRDLCPADPMTLEAAGLEHATRRELVLGILEDAAECPPVRRLRRLAPGVQVANLLLDLGGVPPVQAKLGRDDDLPVSEIRMPIREPQLSRGEVTGAVRGRDEGALEYLGELAAV